MTTSALATSVNEELPVGLIPAVAASESFFDTWPFPARYSYAAGFPMHYIDEGAGHETLLLLHGEPTWGYLFRNQIPLWSKDNRVIAVDHMGFGKSAAPRQRAYWLQDHIDNLERFVLSKDLRDLTLIMHDFGGPVGMGLAIRHPDRIKRIISINGPTPLGQPDLMERLLANAATSPWFQWIQVAEASGILEDVLGHLGFNILSTLKLNGFENNDIITDAWLAAYGAPFPAPEYAAGAIGWAKGLATGEHAFEAPDSAAVTTLARIPALALWGEADRTLHPDQFLPLFHQAFPAGQVQRLPGVGHYSPEDGPIEVAQAVTRFLTRDA